MTTPDMAKAMDLASMIDAYADVGEPPSLTGPELVNLCRAFIAQGAELAELREGMRTIANLSDLEMADGDGARAIAARLTEKAKP